MINIALYTLPKSVPNRSFSYLTKLMLTTITCLTLLGCSLGQRGQALTQLDLGSPTTQTRADSLDATHQGVAIAVPNGLSVGLVLTTGVVWRQGAAGMPQTYATYQWVASPATLVRQRLIDFLSRQRPVFASGLGDQTPILRMNLQQFEQVFQSNGQSEGVLALQVVLTQGDVVLGSEVIYERVAATSADAVAGAQALSIASNRAAERVTTWVGKTLSNRSK
jgi:cholesterol transport system auxiliary component